MSFWLFIKLLAGLAVAGVMAFTGMLAYHVVVSPLGGIFEQIVPNPGEIIGGRPDSDFAKMLDSAELPDIEPGEKAFQKAHELIALGKLEEAREKLMAVVNVFPSSTSAPVARRIVGEMNLDEILSTTHMEGKQSHVVRRGDSYFAIATRHNTTLDCILHLNGMMELGSLQPGDELVVMPLDFRILIEPRRNSVSVWDGGRFIREYPIAHMGVPGVLPNTRTTIDSKTGLIGGRRIPPQSPEYRAAEKVIQLSQPALQIRPYQEDDEDRPRGIFLHPTDMEELSLLTRVGNEVEIRNPAR
jgi:hypothetical protein